MNEETLSTKEHTEAHSKKIGGYKKLTDEQISDINRFKEIETELGNFFETLEQKNEVDMRWLNIARTDLQKGFMSAIRSIAKPSSTLNS